MLLFDAIYVNNGGGKVLLDLVIEKLFNKDQDIFFLLDERLTGQYPFLNPEKVLYIPNSFTKRLHFYNASGSKFSQVVTFGNVPPPIKLDAEVYTYFHNVLYLNPIRGIKMTSLLLKLKVFIISIFSKNTSTWFVQSDLMREKLARRFRIDPRNIMVFPIFQNLEMIEPRLPSSQSTTIKYLYVSDGHPYKNHYNLLNAFSKYHQNSDVPVSLILTVSSKYTILCNFIKNLGKTGISVINRGIISKDELTIEYQNADIVLYPSLDESFGLGLVEAAQFQLPVIAANLPYVREVIDPSDVFDPGSVEDIYRALCESRQWINKPVKLKIGNSLDTMIDIVTNNNESNV